MSGKTTTILFDFDGTLAETMMLIYNVFNRLSSVYGYRHLPEDEIEAVRHLTIHEFIEHVGISLWKVPIVAIHARRLMHQDIHEVHPPKGLADVLTRIHDSGLYHMDIRVKKYIREKGIDPQTLYYVGDTSVDVESARLAGTKAVAVTWGLNTAQALARSNPDHLVDDPRQLLDIFPVE